MLHWTVDALTNASTLSRIVAVGDVKADGLDIVVEPGDTLVENIKRGIDALEGGGERVLLVSADIPMVTSVAIDDFVERATALQVDFAYPIVRREVCESKYPQMKRTYLKTAQGTFTGGNVTMVTKSFVRDNWDMVSGAYDARKQVTRLARIIGVGLLARVIVAQALPWVLNIASLEAAASRVLQASVAAVISDFPDLAEDVDKESDMQTANAILLARGKTLAGEMEVL